MEHLIRLAFGNGMIDEVDETDPLERGNHGVSDRLLSCTIQELPEIDDANASSLVNLHICCHASRASTVLSKSRGETLRP